MTVSSPEHVLSGAADICQVSLDDLPYPLPQSLQVVALLEGGQVLLSRARRPHLRVRFFADDLRRTYGKAWLVGMGPGDPELMTIKAEQVLRRADVIFHDSLIDRSVLDRYPAERMHVGKRKGNHTQQQHEINERLYHAAREGKTVVRLKGGDPFIFGRGGEEAEYLLRRLVPVEVVPGVSAANAAAANTNVPLTKRGISRALLFETVHEGEALAASVPTRVFYMGASRLLQLSRRLLREGLDPDTPVALVQNAVTTDERSVTTTIARMSAVDLASPLMVILGHVARERRADGKCLFTGADPYAFRCPERVVHYPLEGASTPKQIDLSAFAAVTFTSPDTVRRFAALYSGLPGDLLYYCASQVVAAEVEKLAPGAATVLCCCCR